MQWTQNTNASNCTPPAWKTSMLEIHENIGFWIKNKTECLEISLPSAASNLIPFHNVLKPAGATHWQLFPDWWPSLLNKCSENRLSLFTSAVVSKQTRKMANSGWRKNFTFHVSFLFTHGAPLLPNDAAGNSGFKRASFREISCMDVAHLSLTGFFLWKQDSFLHF